MQIKVPRKYWEILPKLYIWAGVYAYVYPSGLITYKSRDKHYRVE